MSFDIWPNKNTPLFKTFPGIHYQKTISQSLSDRIRFSLKYWWQYFSYYGNNKLEYLRSVYIILIVLIFLFWGLENLCHLKFAYQNCQLILKSLQICSQLIIDPQHHFQLLRSRLLKCDFVASRRHWFVKFPLDPVEAITALLKQAGVSLITSLDWR